MKQCLVKYAAQDAEQADNAETQLHTAVQISPGRSHVPGGMILQRKGLCGGGVSIHWKPYGTACSVEQAVHCRLLCAEPCDDGGYDTGKDRAFQQFLPEQ